MLEMMRITHQQVLHFFLNCLLFAALLLSSALDNTISTAQAMRPLHQFNFGRNPPELINGHFHQAASVKERKLIVGPPSGPNPGPPNSRHVLHTTQNGSPPGP
ncbi:unnamed protein product [Cuscuta epithymum]|uniref:Uncharacterized protein n=1 Tax=Cuscuta epithymum TaxID=186058 RepID=A0AAV0FIU2_9ASTE|nr:unnamed protein product [Cuscuta epithymum]